MDDLKSTSEIAEDFLTELQSRAPQITDVNEGSISDALAGTTAIAVDEIKKLVLDKFAKTFFATAHGPEVTGGPDDLQTLAVDHFGDRFARPGANASTGVVTFSRPNNDAGSVTIPAGTVVTTEPNEVGTSQRFETLTEVLMTGVSINASVRALEAGRAGNVQAGTITVIESSLTDSTITVTNGLAFGDGRDAQNDAEYRETIRNLLESLRDGLTSAIEAAAKAVTSVEQAKAVETEMPVIEYDIAQSAPRVGADYFYIPFFALYIADANGSASDVLLASVRAAIDEIRSYGVRINIFAAMPVEMNWIAAISLNASGPNFESLSANPEPIISAMRAYINSLDIGDDFEIEAAEAHIMSLFGPLGTNDIVDIETAEPSGDVIAAVNEKLVAGTVEV